LVAAVEPASPEWLPEWAVLLIEVVPAVVHPEKDPVSKPPLVKPPDVGVDVGVGVGVVPVVGVGVGVPPPIIACDRAHELVSLDQVACSA
jgi:hypothetical protein